MFRFTKTRIAIETVLFAGCGLFTFGLFAAGMLTEGILACCFVVLTALVFYVNMIHDLVDEIRDDVREMIERSPVVRLQLERVPSESPESEPVAPRAH